MGGCQGFAMQCLTSSEWFLACFHTIARVFGVVARMLLCGGCC